MSESYTVIESPKLSESLFHPIEVNKSVALDYQHLLVPLLNIVIVNLDDGLKHLLLVKNVHDPLLVTIVVLNKWLFHEVS